MGDIPYLLIVRFWGLREGCLWNFDFRACFGSGLVMIWDPIRAVTLGSCRDLFLAGKWILSGMWGSSSLVGGVESGCLIGITFEVVGLGASAVSCSLIFRVLTRCRHFRFRSARARKFGSSARSCFRTGWVIRCFTDYRSSETADAAFWDDFRTWSPWTLVLFLVWVV